jgi:ABC-2 type transport system ATP-binding protein
VGLIFQGRLAALGSPAELKTGLMREQILEIACDRPQDALAEVEELPGVREAALFGRGLHAVVGDAAALAPRVRALLDARGYRPSRVERITPTLEDVFVSLIEAHRGAAAGTAGAEGGR